MTIESIWPEWKQEKAIGKGSYGTVYKCYREKDRKKEYSAIKVITIPQDDIELVGLATEGMTVEQTKEYYREIVNDFLNEIRILESLKGEKNIVNIQDYTVIESKKKISWQIFIRMELLTDLNTYLSDKVLNENDVLKLAKDLCNALLVCEKHRIIHRDIKPENIFVDDDGNFKLGDFGVARQLEKTNGPMSTKGTYYYMAPEVKNSSRYDSRADIYSLGLVMYKLLNKNRLPFIDTSKQLIRYSERQAAFEKRMSGDKIPPIENVSPEMNALILKACTFNAEDRYKSVDDFSKNLNLYKKIKINDKKNKKRKTIILVTAAVFCCILIAVSAIKIHEVIKKNQIVEAAPQIDEDGSLVFGTYPQTEATDLELLSKLDGLEKDWKSYNYYCGTGDKNNPSESSNYMKYSDIEFEGKKYRAVQFDKYRANNTLTISSLVSSADESFQLDNKYIVNTTYYFLFEPVRWSIVDKNTTLVVSDLVVDSQAFSNFVVEKNNEFYNSKKMTSYSSDYETSSLRKWLNDDFYNTAFSENEKLYIKNVRVDNKGISVCKYSGKNTYDNVFCLSYDDLTNTDYGFNSNYLYKDFARCAPSSDYAKCQGCYKGSNSNAWWWTRSSSNEGSRFSCSVGSEGAIIIDTNTSNACGGIRPSMYLKKSVY